SLLLSPSFPTRRSSGLDEFVGLVQCVNDFVAADGDGRLPLGAPFDLDMPVRRNGAVRVGWGPCGNVPSAFVGGYVDHFMTETALDRKSTRLNSSHVSIS